MYTISINKPQTTSVRNLVVAPAFYEPQGMDPGPESGANKAGIDTINLQLAMLFMMGGLFLQMHVRQVKYLNNIVEQD